MSKPCVVVAALTAFAVSIGVGAKTLDLVSPDEKIRLQITDDGLVPSYSLSYGDTSVLEASQLGMVFKQAAPFKEGFAIVDAVRQSHSDRWEQPWGERRWVDDRHNELLVTLANEKSKQRYHVRFRLFDDGLGFRYEVPAMDGQREVTIVDELTEFVIPSAHRTEALWIPSRGWNRYEYQYQMSTVEQIDRVHTPFTFKLPSGIHASIHEAALVDYAAMSLDQQRGGILEADLAPWSDGSKVKKSGAFFTPWRTVQVAPDAKGLLNSDLILNLNEPNKLGDVSWVVPGKYVGIWWCMHVNECTWGSGEKHGATTKRTKAYMDFAAKYGFDGVLVEGWNVGWDGSWFHNGDVFSFIQPYEDFDFAALAAYGQQQGVRLIGHHETSGSVSNYRRQMEAAFDLYQQHHVSQVKTGYVADGGNIKRIDAKGIERFEWHDGQFMSNEYLHNVILAAKHQISINTHEPIKDTGLRRTYPNWISREGARGQEFNAWGNPPNSPEHTVNLVYTRMLSGPMDFTPGIFNLLPNGDGNPNRVQTTLAKQLALYVVLYSPIQMAADLPRHYEANMPAFQFIRDVPTDWEQSIGVDGEMGEYAVFARQERGGHDWYLGAITDGDARQLLVPLDFLEPGKRYEAQIYRDGAEADWRTNPYDLTIETKPVSADDSLRLALATSGGVAIRFKAL